LSVADGDRTGFLEALGLVFSVEDRLTECFEGDRSFFLARTVAPTGPPRTGVFLVVVLDLDNPSLAFTDPIEYAALA